MHGAYQGVVICLVPDGDADEFPTLKALFPAAILDQDGVVFQQETREGTGFHGRHYLAHEVVGLGGEDVQEGNAGEFLHEAVSFLHEPAACAHVGLFIFPEDLHVKFGNGINVPDGNVLFYPCNQLFVCRGQNPQAEAWNAVGL